MSIYNCFHGHNYIKKNGISHESGAVFGDPLAGHRREMVSTNHVWLKKCNIDQFLVNKYMVNDG